MAAKRRRKETRSFDVDTSRAQWLKGVLEICLLSVIGDGEAYGYEIASQLEAAGLGTIKGGTLYPRLTALETSGLVDVEWRQGENGPGRKYYRLTLAGKATLAETAAAYTSFSNVVSGLLSTGGSVAPVRDHRNASDVTADTETDLHTDPKLDRANAGS